MCERFNDNLIWGKMFKVSISCFGHIIAVKLCMKTIFMSKGSWKSQLFDYVMQNMSRQSLKMFFIQNTKLNKKKKNISLFMRTFL